MRFALSAVSAVLVASVALANAGPPGSGVRGRPFSSSSGKWVKVHSELLLSEKVTGYVFVLQGVPNRLSESGHTFSRIELSDTKPFRVTPMGTRETRLVAVPVGEAKAYKSDDELFNAIRANQIKGAHHIECGWGKILVEEAMKEDEVRWTMTITAIDAKDGIRAKTSGPWLDQQDRQGEDEKKPLALSEPGTLIGGLAAALSITLGGLWLARRRK